MRDVLPEIERRMLADFPDRLRDWSTRLALAKAAREGWRRDLRDAAKRGGPLPSVPMMISCPQPQAPRLRQHDVTIEKVAELLAHAAPKGLLIVRDELAGWISFGGAVVVRRGRGFATADPDQPARFHRRGGADRR